MSASRRAPSGHAIERELWPGDAVEPLRLRRAPLLAAALWFAFGEVLAHDHAPAALLAIAILLLTGLTVIGLYHGRHAATIAIAGLWIAVGLWCFELAPPVPSQQQLLSYADGLSRMVQGRVVRVRKLPPITHVADADADPTTWNDSEEQQAGALSVDLAVDRVEEVTPDLSRMMPVSQPSGVRVTILGAAPHLRCGQQIEAPLRMKIPEHYRDPGAWQYADYLLTQGIGAHASVKEQKIQLLSDQHTHWSAVDLRCHLYAAQAWAASRMLAYVASPENRRLPPILQLSPEDAGMLDAMLFGDRTRLNHALRLGFERTGSFHLFVVSGLHVALLAGCLFWLTRRLRLGPWTATTVTVFLTAAYALLTGFGAPVQRALAMSAIFLFTRLLARKHAILNALGAAALAVLVWSPRALFESSFQMTFLAVVAIAGVAVPLGERSFLPYARAARRVHEVWLDVAMEPRLAQFRVMLREWSEVYRGLFGRRFRDLPAALVRILLWATELVLIGLVTEMIMVLPMALYFHRATMFALPANIFSIPLVAILAPLGLVTFLASLAGGWAALLPGAVTALLLHTIVGVIGQVSSLRAADLRIPAPMLEVSLGVVLVWAFCCWAVRRSRVLAWTAVALLPLAALAVLWPEPSITIPGRLEVTAIDVGQGDSLLVVAPTGKTMLIDAGGPTGAVKETAEATSRFDIGEEIVSPYLWWRRFRHLDVLVLTHAHSDHMGGMPAVLRNFRPRELWVSVDPHSSAYQALLAEAAQYGVTVRHLRAGAEMDWSQTGVHVSVLAPEASYRNTGVPVNDDSLVLRLQFGRSSALLEGDAEATSEYTMLAAHRIAPVTLLKVGHHGSHTSTTAAFLAATAPKDAVISVGRGNSFGHPAEQTIDRIAHEGARLYRTDEFGLTTFLLSRNGRIHAVLGAADQSGDDSSWLLDR